MPFPKAKVYSDGSHYICIPHTEDPNRKRGKRRIEEIIEVPQDPEENASQSEETESKVQKESEMSSEQFDIDDIFFEPIGSTVIADEKKEQDDKEKTKNVRKMTKRELFDEIYKELWSAKKSVKRKVLREKLAPYFKSEETLNGYIEEGLERKRKNMVARRIRIKRKANLADFNFFVTFTYSDELHTEETFRKKLKNTLSLQCCRKGWKYIGVWERSPEKKRLHFHGMFYIPPGTLPGEMKEESVYSFSEHKRKTMHENSYFRERFGRNDFESMDTKHMLDDAVGYITKYIEKTGEKIVYSRGLPQFFIADVLDDAIVCPLTADEKKFVLFDNFECFDEGCLIGRVSKEVIEKMPKCN